MKAEEGCMEVDIDSVVTSHSTQGYDVIKEQFKYFKRRKPPPDLSQLIDFDQDAEEMVENAEPYQLCCNEDGKDLTEFGLVNPSDWKAYALKSHPGLVFIRNPFTVRGQHYWAGRCLRDLPALPNKTNLDAQGLLPPGDNWWKLCLCGADWDRLRKLRWVTLGFHHDWNSKLYNMCDRSAFPPDLAGLAALVARTVGCADYAPEAAIVNYYHAESTLAPHTDQSEWDMTAPLLSFSFGQSAVFLLGGLDRSAAPAAMLVRSGDVLVMSGRCRLSYHGVPRILPAHDTRWHDWKRKLSVGGRDDRPAAAAKLARRAGDAARRAGRQSGAIRCECAVTGGDLMDAEGDAADDAVSAYLRRCRINMNVRQVLPRGMMLAGDRPP